MNKPKRKPRLPNTLHGLLTIALADLRKTEQDPRYKVDMCTWHEPVPVRDRFGCSVHGKQVCNVCLAGSVMAQRLDTPRTKWATPDEEVHGKATAGKLCALNHLRCGYVLAALSALRPELPRKVMEELERKYGSLIGWRAHRITQAEHDRAMAIKTYPRKYHQDQEGFYADMETLRKELKAANL